MARLHPDSNFLAEYSAGGLSPAQSISVSAHLHFCAQCRDRILSLEEIGGVLLEQTAPETVSADALESVLGRIDSPAEQPAARREIRVTDSDLSRLPKLVQRLMPEGKPGWRKLSPSLEIARIPVGETVFELALHKIKPGGTAPLHDHKGREITVVLQGSFSDDDGVYQEGDFVVREPGDVHTPMATQHDQCICLSACEAPIRMVGPFKRLLNPFISFRPA
ncbi:MAG: ChrR family anti-sigma-E factor [Pseudomonadota bacterium]